MSPQQELAGGIEKLGLKMPIEGQDRLLQYLGLLLKWNRVHNLTAIRQIAPMVSAHLLDSLSVATVLSAEHLLDVGSGGGLPGIPLALLWPDAEITLIDSSQKKTAFLQQAKIELDIKNLTVVCSRVEAWQSPAPFDVVISRAFADLQEFAMLAGRHCKKGGTLMAMKGMRPNEEIEGLNKIANVRKIVAVNVPNLNAERHLVLIDP